MMVYNKKFGVEFEFLDNGKTVADWCVEHGVEFINFFAEEIYQSLVGWRNLRTILFAIAKD